MKCTNCGFDAADNEVCPICGNKMFDNTGTAPAQTHAEPDAEINPYLNTPQANTDTVRASRQFQPQQPIPAPPQAPAYPNTPPTAPQGNPYPAAPAVKAKKSKAAPIVLASIVAAVALAGIVITVCSRMFYDESADNIRYDSPEYLYESDYYDNNVISDDVVRKVGETYDFGTGEVTMTDARFVDEIGGRRIYAFTFKVQNNTDENFIYSFEDGGFYDEWDDHNFLYNAGDFEEYEPKTLEPGESAEIMYFFSFSENTMTRIFEVSINAEPENSLSALSSNYIYSSYEINLGEIYNSATPDEQ